MKKPVIAVDVDDVLVSTAGAIIDDYNMRWGTNVTLEAFYASHDSSLWGTDEQTSIRRVDSFVLSPAFTSLPPTQEVIQAINYISQRYELHVLTGRPDTVAVATKDWLQLHFPNIFASANFSNLFNDTKRRSKGEMAHELSADLLIDDHVRHLESVADYGIAGILFGSYPWNENESLPDGVVRCQDWPAVVEYLDEKYA